MKNWAWQCLLALILIATLPVPAKAAETPAPTPVRDNSPTPLIINNQPVMEFRSPFMGLTPSERAEGARARLKEYIKNHGYDSLAAQPTPQGVAVTINHDVMFVVTPGDIRDIPGANLQGVADHAVETLKALESQERMDNLKHKVTGFKVSSKWLLILLGIVGLVGIGLYALRSMVMGNEDQGLVRCPKCGNMNEALIRFQEEPSSLRILRKYYCDACGHKWKKNG